MKRFLQMFVGVGAAVAVAVGVAGCGSSPYAAKFNATTISQDSLNNELNSLASNQVAVAEYAKEGLTVHGSGPGTYNSAWVASVLQALIVTGLVHQDLAGRHDLPTAADLPAGWATASLEYGTEWSSFSRSYQAVLAERYAELIKLAPVRVPANDLTTIYSHFRSTFYSQVCANQIAVTKTNPDGSVNRAASLAAAVKLQRQINSGSSKVTGSSLGCFTPSRLEQYPTFERTLITTEPVGHASTPYAAAYGYYLIQVSSRTTLARNDPTTVAALSYLAAQILSQQRNIASPVQLAVVKLAKGAKVKINPAYGTWHSSTAANNAGLGLHAPVSPSFS